MNDPMLGRQWGINTIQAPTAWYSSLAGKVTLEHNVTAMASADDLCNHATHVAGIIAADTITAWAWPAWRPAPPAQRRQYPVPEQHAERGQLRLVAWRGHPRRRGQRRLD